MSKKNKNRNPVDALERMNMEAASEVTGYNESRKAANALQDSAKMTDKMAAEGEAVAESLGNATIDNKYNSSTKKSK